MKRNAKNLTAMLAAMLTLLGTSGTALAAAFIVSNTPDMPDLVPGDGLCNAGPPFGCTLRAAIQETNALPGSDSIDVGPGVFNLTRVGAGEDLGDKGDLDIRDHVLIVGTGPVTVIDGLFLDRVFDIHSIAAVPLVVTLGEMSVRRGYSGSDAGGAIRNASHLTTKNVTVTDSISELRGGGIAGIGTASFRILTTGISKNRAGSKDCSIPGLGGGGLYVPATANPHVVVVDSYITNNMSCTKGGGILAEGAVRLTDVSVAGNSAPIGYGAGIFANVIELDRVTLDSNRGLSGSGLTVRGEARILDSTISANVASRGGGGVSSFGWLYMRHVTMANNTSGDPAVPSGGLVHYGGFAGFPKPEIVNSILADNALANCRILDTLGATMLLNNNSARNVDTDNSCGFSTVGPSGSIVLVPANLAPLLANPGSRGKTHLLLAGSPARDNAEPLICSQRDQRYLVRPIGAGCDIGSTEQ